MKTFFNVLILLFALESLATINMDSKHEGTLKIGLYTGTFDPPHVGHMTPVIEAQKELGLDIVYVVPNATTPHKKDATPFHHRRAMTELTFSHLPYVRFIDQALIEAYEKDNLAGAIKKLAERHPNEQLYKITGADSVGPLISKFSDNTLSNYHFVIIERAGENIPEFDRGQVKSISQVTPTEEELRLNLSSTLIRNIIANHQEFSDHIIKEEVLDYIYKHKLDKAYKRKAQSENQYMAFLRNCINSLTK